MAFCNGACRRCGYDCARQDPHEGACDCTQHNSGIYTAAGPAPKKDPDLSPKLNRARRKITKLRKLLQSVERVQQRWNGCPECPFCGELFAGRGDTHQAECEVFTQDGELRV